MSLLLTIGIGLGKRKSKPQLPAVVHDLLKAAIYSIRETSGPAVVHDSQDTLFVDPGTPQSGTR